MDRAAYASLNALEGEHWWFVARRRLINHLIARHIRLPAAARILEAGCGTGGNLALLAAHGKVDALEYDAEARGIAAARGAARVAPGRLPDAIGFGDTTYDLIVLLDVLEHIDEDGATLAALKARLAPGGRILLTVPASPWLWSEHDVLHHHKRRYSSAALDSVAHEAGLQIVQRGHFNSLLFPVAAVTRLFQRVARRPAAPDGQPIGPVNAMLREVFALERHLLGRLRLPFGLSLYAILSG